LRWKKLAKTPIVGEKLRSRLAPRSSKSKKPRSNSMTETGSTSSLDSVAAKYWDDHSDQDTRSIVCWEFPEVVKRFDNRRVTGSEDLPALYWFYRKYGPFKEAASIGCGTGIVERCLVESEHFNGQIVGLDISPRSLEQARANCAGYKNVRFEVADLNIHVWPASVYDVVFAHGALHHIEKLDWVLGQIARSLKPNGFLYVNDYVGPQRFQWSDLQLRLANELLANVPAQWVNNPRVERCDPLQLARRDPSEACQSHVIEDTIRAHFRTIERRPRGGGLLAPIFGGSCLRESILENTEGAACIRKLCEVEASLFDQGIIPTNHVVIVAKPRLPHPNAELPIAGSGGEKLDG
jgi:ubiquinone/menaquinone biosynthesis C-methylase UbiE